jgi:hypothetical protein
MEPARKDHAMKTIGVLNYSSTVPKLRDSGPPITFQDSSTQLYMLGCYVLFVYHSAV